MKQLKVFSGRASRVLASEIASYLGIPLGQLEIVNFSDGEVFVQIQENIRGCDVFLVQSICYPPNEHLMELLIILDACKRASAERITAVLPYFAYGRQDRKSQPRVPITGKLVADLLSTAGAQRILTMDLHAGQIQGFFNIPVDHLFASPVLVEHIRSYKFDNLVVIAPDAGGVERARAFAKRLGCSLGIVDKRREEKNVAKVMRIIGEVRNRNTLVVDDIVDTAGTLVETASALLAEGARSVYACCTHPVLSGPAIGRINESALSELVTTNTIPLLANQESEPKKITVLSVAHLLGEAVKRIHSDDSVSSLFI
ncbi:MAG: ribose-phosphate pyrophosphokinase [Candidatus Tectomicrobia bacterium]|nr:ribose-phosphate pyrophosphokinase [Candidatus Tectomicrobia bacterium]